MTGWRDGLAVVVLILCAVGCVVALVVVSLVTVAVLGDLLGLR